MEPSAAILGSGFMSWVHLDALRRNQIRVTGILGSSPDKSRTAARQLGLQRAYGSLDEVLSDPDVNVLHICTPNRLHLEMAERGLESGRHILCEKPLAMTAAESARLVRVAAAHPQLADGVNYNIRYYPLCQEVRGRLQAGDLGSVFHVNGSYVQDWLLKQEDYNWRVLSDEGGELRAVSDIGTHWLDLILWMTGLKVDELCADLLTAHPVRHRPTGEVVTFAGKDNATKPNATIPVSISTDDYGAVLLKFAGGARGTLVVSQVNAGRKNCLRFEIAGQQGSCAWNSESPNELWLGHRDRPNEQLIRDPSLLNATARPHALYPGGHNEGYADSFRACFADFYDHIRRGQFVNPAYPTFADGHREIVLCEAILQSQRTRSWTAVPAA